MTAGVDVALDEMLLVSLRSYEDARSGIRERFLTPLIGGQRTMCVLSSPTGRAHDMGWVICHSFAMEQIWLQPVEVAAARRLSAAGFPVLRFHSQGYGDSEGSTAEIGLQTHVRDAIDAIRVLKGEANVSRLGLIGGRVGGTVAALAADRSEAESLILWEPIVGGRGFVEKLTRAAMVTELSSSAQVKARAGDVERNFAEAGVLDVQGFPLSSAVFEEFSAFDLLPSITHFTGEALIVQISRAARIRVELERLNSRLNEVGGRSSLQVIVDPEGWTFGMQRYYAASDGRRKEDRQAAMSEELVSRSLSWCLREGTANTITENEHG